MSNELVTISTHMNETEAYILVNRLKDIDITAIVADANIVGMDFLVGAAIRWIKVQVPDGDVERALAYLEQEAKDKVPEEDIPWDDVEPEAGEDPAELRERIAAQKEAIPEVSTGGRNNSPIRQCGLSACYFWHHSVSACGAFAHRIVARFFSSECHDTDPESQVLHSVVFGYGFGVYVFCDVALLLLITNLRLFGNHCNARRPRFSACHRTGPA